MKKSLLTIAAAFCYSLAVLAQAPPQRNCGTLQHHEYLKQTRPNYENDLNQYNQMIDQYLADKAAGINVGKTSNTSAIVTVPVVVHVVYRVAGENISDAQAASQVQVLNDDFAKLNSDASKVTQPTFSTIATGAQIRFCLAQRDPSGNPTTGVTHNTTTVTAFGTNDAVKSNATGGVTAWDVTKYVNIWVCNLGASLLGYGEFPTGSLSNTWGLVLHYKYTGSGGTAIAPYNLGRTGTHEFGHCFNLYHIWGDDGSACTGSDQCTDTPNQASEHYGCFAQGSIQTDACAASSPGTMWMNYMDYTDDACMYMFTAQQCARMEAIVNTAPWNVLGTSLGCTPVSALDAGISSIIAPVAGSSTCNNSVTPKITLANTGSTTFTTATILYKMDALATQTLNWTGSLASGTSTILTLNTYAGLSNAAHTFSATVQNPNGTADGNAANNTLTSTFTVIAAPAGAALPFTERFDAVTFPPTGWVQINTNTLDAAYKWTRLANTTGIPVVPTTTACAKMDNFAGSIDISGQKDALRTPALSLVGANATLRVVFDRSHKMYSTVDIDSLNIYISTDCGGSWTRLYTKGGTQLSTSAGVLTTAYTPTANAQWARDSVSLSAYVGQASVYLKFESRSGWGNNLYLDNINVKYTPSSSPPVASFTTAATKCVGSSIAFTDASTNGPTSWSWTFPGSTTPTSTAQNPSVTYTAGGTYTVTLTSANGSGTSTAVSSTITVSANPTVSATSATVCSGTAASITASGATTYSWNTGATTASISVTPTITTTYTVTGTNAAGCANTKTTTVNVNAAPTVTVANATICSGNSANLTASGAATYSWNTGATTASISVTPTATIVYTVTGTTTGCTNTKTVSVTVNTTPVVAASNATICSGSSTALTASGATTYSWNTGATTTSISVSPTTTTNYTVTGTTTGCSNTKTLSVMVNASPTVTATGGSICNGASANIMASGATTYSWNTGATTASITVTPTTTTVYTVTGTTTGCSNVKTVTVTVNPLPNVAATSATICVGATGTITASGAATYSWNTGATTAALSASPSSNTVYTVTGTSAAGCVKTTTAMITVGTAPSISVNSSTICAGATATLSASGVTTYTWNTSSNATSISVSPTSTSVYTVSGNLTGCAVAAMQTATVTVNTLPTVAMNSVGGPLCVANAPVNLVGTPSGGTFSGTGVVGSTFDPSVSGAGTFTVMYNYTDANSCSAVDSKTVNVSLCTGITELTNTNISIYPNPARDVINVMMDAALINNTTIELYDAIGKLVIAEKVVNVQTTIKIDSLVKGIYTVRIVSEGKQVSKRIIKE